jgi:hypothetical protein
MGRQEGMGTTLFKKKNNSIEDSVVNEENGYPVPDPNETVTIVIKDPSDVHKNKLSKRTSWKKSLRNSWRRH